MEISVKYEGYIARQAAETREFKRLEDTVLPEDADYETFGGFLCAVLGEIPADGETLSLRTHGLQVDILQVDDHRIERTRVTRLDAPPDEAGAE